MNKFIWIALIGGIGVLLYKYASVAIRVYFFNRTIDDIENMYSRILRFKEQAIEDALEDLKDLKSGDHVISALRSEQELIQEFKETKSFKKHEEEIRLKYCRLREKFIHNYPKLCESIVIYQRYLKNRLWQIQDASIYSRGFISGVIDYDEFVSKGLEQIAVIDENEKKINKLLSE